MSPTHLAELAALVDAGDGMAELFDPVTRRTFLVVEQTKPHPCAHPETDEELARQLKEASDEFERGEVCTLSIEEILVEARRRYASESERTL